MNGYYEITIKLLNYGANPSIINKVKYKYTLFYIDYYYYKFFINIFIYNINKL